MKSQVYSICAIALTWSTINHLINPRIESLNEANIYIKCTSSARIWSYLHCMFWRFPCCHCRKGFPKVADWLDVQCSLKWRFEKSMFGRLLKMWNYGLVEVLRQSQTWGWVSFIIFRYRYLDFDTGSWTTGSVIQLVDVYTDSNTHLPSHCTKK